ncbi:hypothetical protein HMPREF3034_02390 [Prevotella sp. DNF00663]|uniref:PH domain-containing protein n=1 Tax=unclassified Prevotella TaxID=2638335 RepID=UPI0005147A82|nr:MULTISPECIES: PH domain-containing protein [unclassified Prevotella]KGI60591.1 hypothetical protein HMPREF0671_05150 [Prevotella sp. S7 MS 2]KXB78587.1 hypothetical protein HMPREF3034_02390 [Prevotella sp. DNF00663]
MRRVFHQRLTPISVCSIIIFALLAFYFFWLKMPIPGFLTAIAIVLMTERLLHTVYIFDMQGVDDVLQINHGRFSKTITIRVSEVVRVTQMTSAFGLSHYLLLEYGNGHLTSLQPDNEETFRNELNKRLKQHDEIQ